MGTDFAPGDSGDALAVAFARCFRGADGEYVSAYLRKTTLDRALGPDAPDAQLRHLEGQRQLVSRILHLVERGRGKTAMNQPTQLTDEGTDHV